MTEDEAQGAAMVQKSPHNSVKTRTLRKEMADSRKGRVCSDLGDSGRCSFELTRPPVGDLE